MSDKINGIALSTNTREDAMDYGLVHDPTTGSPIIFQLSDNPPIPHRAMVLSHWTEGRTKLTITFLIVEKPG